MWSFMTDPENKDDVMVKSNAEVRLILRSNNLASMTWQGVEKVKAEQGGFAFMMEDAGIQYLIERNCELAQVNLSLSTLLGQNNCELYQYNLPQTFLHRLEEIWIPKAMGLRLGLAQASKTS